MLGKLARQQDANVLVGFDKADDAGVYKISADRALVQTVDFFTPVVDDPYTYGQIAATNALSDVYAMGGTPRTALAIVCFPETERLEILEQILAGGLSKMTDASCTVIGGHSVRDPEIKFGYAVTGMIDPSRIFTNSGARAGDRLLLTKSLGTGVIATAIKRAQAKDEWRDAAIRSMTTLNRVAAEIASAADFSVHSMTDITGFGLIGHAREMAAGSAVSLRIYASSVPLMAGALECVRSGFVPGGLRSNWDFSERVVEYERLVPDDVKTLLFDPQTAGGLLIAVSERDASRLAKDLSTAGVEVAQIGEVVQQAGPLIFIQ